MLAGKTPSPYIRMHDPTQLREVEESTRSAPLATFGESTSVYKSQGMLKRRCPFIWIRSRRTASC